MDSHPAPDTSVTRIVTICVFAGLTAAFGINPAIAQPRAPDSPTYGVPVVVNNFELYSAPVRLKTPAKSEPEKPKVPMVYGDEDAPSLQARRMTEYFAVTLVRELEKKGFHATRAAGTNPLNGALIRGVFAEADPLNRIRRALLGAVSPSPKFLLYVGIFNLEKQEQPLYQLATDQPPSPGYGPIITLNNYIPLAKYELDKNPSEEEVQKICAQIAGSLVTLLESNPHAFAR